MCKHFSFFFKCIASVQTNDEQHGQLFFLRIKCGLLNSRTTTKRTEKVKGKHTVHNLVLHKKRFFIVNWSFGL